MSGQVLSVKPLQARGELHRLCVARLSGEELQVEVEGECTVKQLAQRVAESLGVQPTSLRLVQDACMLSKGERVENLKDSKITAISVPTSEYGLSAGDRCQTLREVLIRSTEDLESEAVEVLAKGAVLEVADVGEGRRLLVSGEGGTRGWISYKTRLNSPLVAKIAESTSKRVLDLEIGQQYEVCWMAELLEGPLPCRVAMTKLAPGTKVVVLEVLEAEAGAEVPGSARVVTSAGGDGRLGLDGWLPLAEIPGKGPLLRAEGDDGAVEAQQPQGDTRLLTTFLNAVWQAVW